MFLLLTMTAMAQQQNVSGQVLDAQGKPIPNVSVREVDKDNRVLNHTKADANGMFSFVVRDAQHWIQFYSPDYVTLTHKILGKSTVKATMELKGKMDIKKSRILLRTKKLICGMANGTNIPQKVWLEQLQDTVFSIIVPVSVNSVIDEYPAGRTLTVVGKTNSTIMELRNVVDAYPVNGDPDEISDHLLSHSGNGVDNDIMDSWQEDENLYCYPHFKVTLSQLRFIMDNIDNILCLNVDTYRADNYWNLYLLSDAKGLIEKALKKASK